MVAFSEKKKFANSENLIIVVSGLPRSGTSLMMQILQAAGFPLLVDDARQADENNPKGYFEYQAVKNLKKNNQWLEQAKGKAVKIISHLLFYLPENFQYKIIFMNRDLDEIIASQNKMLKNLGKASDMDEIVLKRQYARHLIEVGEWISRQKNLQVQKINFRNLFESPETELTILANFLNINLDVTQIKQVITPELYRSKKSDVK